MNEASFYFLKWKNPPSCARNSPIGNTSTVTFCVLLCGKLFPTNNHHGKVNNQNKVILKQGVTNQSQRHGLPRYERCTLRTCSLIFGRVHHVRLMQSSQRQTYSWIRIWPGVIFVWMYSLRSLSLRPGISWRMCTRGWDDSITVSSESDDIIESVSEEATDGDPKLGME